MTLRDLEYFAAVAELGHFGRAADVCCVSQPTLSGQLRKLEDELGQDLFERSTRSLRLSPFGQEALVLAKRVLDARDALERKAREGADPFSGPLSLGAFPTLGPWLFPRLVPSLREAYPKTSFRLVEEKSARLLERLEGEDLDAAFLALPAEGRGLEVLPLFSEPFLAAVPEGHPWARRSAVAPEELSGQALLLLEDGHCLRGQALDLCARYGASEAAGGDGAVFRATSLETLRQMVRLGAGLTLMPRLAVPELPEPGLRYLPFLAGADGGAPAKRDLGLVFRATHPRRACLLDLASRLRALRGTVLPLDALPGN